MHFPQITVMRVVLDIVTIEAGRGGTGSGIWTYAEQLLLSLGASPHDDVEIFVLARGSQRKRLAHKCPHLKFPKILWPVSGLVFRLFWVHVILPLICLVRHVDILHKLATETPLFCPAQRVTTIHDFYYDFLQRQKSAGRLRFREWLGKLYFSLVTQICVRSSQAIITVSKAVQAEALVRYPELAGRLVVIHHGAPNSAESVMRLPDPGGPCVFVYVAKLMPYKGQLTALHALERLHVVVPAVAARVRLRFRGFCNDEAYERELRAAVARSPLASQIEFVGYDPGTSVATIYQEASAALLLSHYEGFGFPVIEAQSRGVPVICSDLPVLREVAGDAALFVSPEDTEAVAAAMRSLSEEPSCGARLRDKGFANLRRFSWTATAQHTLQVYRDVWRQSTDRIT